MPSNAVSAADLSQKLKGIAFPAKEEGGDSDQGERGGTVNEMARRDGKHSHDRGDSSNSER